MTETERKYYERRSVNHFHGVFMSCVAEALREGRMSIDQFADHIGMTHRRIRLLLTGSTDLTLHDLSDAAMGIQCELRPQAFLIRLEPVMTAEDLGIAPKEAK